LPSKAGAFRPEKKNRAKTKKVKCGFRGPGAVEKGPTRRKGVAREKGKNTILTGRGPCRRKRTMLDAGQGKGKEPSRTQRAQSPRGRKKVHKVRGKSPGKKG